MSSETKGEGTLLQRSYIQKSKLFLLPLTAIKRDRVFKPSNTYICSPDLISEEYPSGIDDKDYILIVEFPARYKPGKKEESEESSWDKYEVAALFSNKNFIGFHEAGNSFVYTFDLSYWKSDWNKFLEGRYSLFSKEAKDIVYRYREGVLSDEDKRKIKSYLHPYIEEFIKQVADELGEDVEDIRKVKELCSAPDIKKETYRIG